MVSRERFQVIRICHLNTLNFGTYVYYNNQWIKTIRPDSNANPELRWEKKKEINIGVDFGFWEDRITGNIDYYNRKNRRFVMGL